MRTEQDTRSRIIDRQLEQAGWRLDDRTQIRREVLAAHAVAEPKPPEYKAGAEGGITDNCMYDSDGTVLAVNECKRTCRSAREGEEQLRLYVKTIGAQQGYSPFGFMSNGLETWFWEVGIAHPRPVSGFFSRDDLRRLRFIRENCRPLAAEAVVSAAMPSPTRDIAAKKCRSTPPPWRQRR